MSGYTPGPTTTRRRLLAAAAGVAVAGPAASSGIASSSDAAANQQATPTPTTTPTPAPDVLWPLFQFDARNSGYRPDGEGPSGSVGARWGHVDGESYTTTPVVRSDAVVAADEGAGVVRAVSTVDGTELWRTELELGASRMTVRGGTVYVPTRQTGAQLHALDATSGDRLWDVNLGSAASSAALSGNGLYVSTNGGLHRVSLLSREVSWQTDAARLRDTAVAIADGAVYASGTRYGNTVKLNASSGGRVWVNNLPSAAQDAPTVADGNVVIPLEDALISLNDTSGTERWRYDAPVRGSVAVGDGVVYGTTDGEAFALNLDDGSLRWRIEAVPGTNRPVLVGGLLYLAGSDGTLAALNPTDGTVVWTTDLGAGLATNPAVVGGELYVADQSGRLAALDPGADGGLGEPTPTRTPTSSASPTRTRTPSPTDTPAPTATPGGGDGPSNGDGSTDGGDGTAGGGTPTSALFDGDGTPTPASDGGLDLPLIGGGIAALLALLGGGGLLWRRQQGDEYDPLG